MGDEKNGIDSSNDQLEVGVWRPKYLSDEPCEGEGSFAVHPIIAEAVASEIKSSSPDNIALIGEWGSGKSSILAGIEKRLPDGYVFFPFDAWAHSGDSLRKSFLLSLISTIEGRFPRDKQLKGKLTVVKNDLNGCLVTTHQTERVEFPPLTSALLVAVSSYVFFGIFFSCVIELIQLCGVDLFPSFSLVDLLGLDLLSFVCAVAAGVVVYAIRRRKCHTSGTYDNLLDELSGFFGKRPTTTTMKQEQRPASLDSLTFEKNYNSILDTLDERSIHLVVAFDNIDRLNHKELESAWNTLQVFAGSSRGRSWVLMPASWSVFSYLGKTDSRNAVAKLFMRTFEIPFPISTAWKAFFMQCACEAFPSADEQERELVYLVASRLYAAQESRLPRNAKLFLNEMVSHALVHPELPISSIAIYCFLGFTAQVQQGEGASFSDEILAAIGKTSSSERLIKQVEAKHATLRNDLAMLAFGQTTPEGASEAFTVSIIRRSLSAKEQLPISAMVKDKPGAWDLIYAAVEEIVDEGNATSEWCSLQICSLNDSALTLEETDGRFRLRLGALLLSAVDSVCFMRKPGFGIVVGDVLAGASRYECERVLQMLTGALPTAISMEHGSTERAVYLEDFCEVLDRVSDAHANTGFNEFAFTVQGKDIEFFVGWISSRKKECSWLEKVVVDDPEGVARSLHLIIEEAGEERVDAIKSQVVSRLNNSWGKWMEYLAYEEVLGAYPAIEVEGSAAAHIKIATWMLLNEYGCESDVLLGLFEGTAVECDSLVQLASLDSERVDAALLDLAISDVNCLDAIESQKEELLDSQGPMKYLCGIKEGTFDDISNLVRGDSNKESYIKLFKCAWAAGEMAERSMQDCMLYSDINNDRGLRANLGKQIAASNRENELCAIPFSIDRRSLYLGVLDASKDSVFYDWLASGLSSISEKNWEHYLHRWPESDSLFQLVGHYDTTALPLPLLGVAAANLLRQGSFTETLKSPRIFDRILLSDLLLDALDEVFFERAEWRRLSSSIPKVFIESNWFNHLSVDRRLLVVERILKTNAIAHCELLESMMVHSSASPKKLFVSKLSRARELLERASKRSKMRGKGKEACSRMLAMLK